MTSNQSNVIFLKMAREDIKERIIYLEFTKVHLSCILLKSIEIHCILDFGRMIVEYELNDMFPSSSFLSLPFFFLKKNSEKKRPEGAQGFIRLRKLVTKTIQS